MLTYQSSPSAKPSRFSFSLDHALDAIIAGQNSGHYCMTVDYYDSKTARFLAIKDISITQGQFVSKIDLAFFDDPELNIIEQVCQEET